jgi:hypothetical protein
MNNCEGEIASAVKALGLGEAQVSKCDSAKSTEVARRAKGRFVEGNPRVWWLGFRKPYDSRTYGDSNDWEQRLMTTIPHPTKRCWLIAESESEAYPVYDVQIGTIVAVLKECCFFEYYLVDPDFNWIVADTDHNQLILARPIE